ncbi:MAG: flagellar hook-length control protein FliK [Lachnospiraceae bacterium]|nr:flagellar hook-length control protein FliK [Lachnospiraceae bacterium]
MKLTDFINTDRQKTDMSQRIPTDAAKVASVNRQIRSMVPGQTIQGEVVSRNGSEVQIRLAEDMILNARLEQNMNLDIGKIMSFEVRNNGKSLLLSPLFANTATDANVLKALDMASLPVNSTTVNMTRQLMDAGLPIDRASLQQVFREVNAFSDAEVSDIVDLHRLSLPVNEENVQQMASYKNLTYQITSGMTQVVDELYHTMQNMTQNGNVEGAARIYLELLQNFAESELTSGVTLEQGALAGADGTGNMSGSAGVLADIVQNPAEPMSAEQDALLKMLTKEGYLESIQQTESAGNGANAHEVQSSSQGEPNSQGEQNVQASTVRTLLNDLSLLSGEPLPQDMTQEQMLGVAGKLLQEGINAKDGTVLTGLLKNESFQEVLKEKLLENFMLSPEDVADASKVEDLYTRLDKQLKSLTRALEQANQQGTESYKAVNNMSQNLDFLQQVNQMYTYVQLPLKFQEGTAHGDLYVYTNKKNLAAKDGKVSALLHLDMENLGPLDVYVSLQNQKVNTQFYVQDDEMLDFLNEHMDILTNRLKNRGYDCSCQMQVRGSDTASGEENKGAKGKGGIHNLLTKSGHMNLAQYAFDVRA